jgi:hypothetical protein
MLSKRQLTDKNTGQECMGFFVINKRGKTLAIGANDSFVIMKALRYEHDKSLVAAVERLTGIKVRLSPPKKLT